MILNLFYFLLNTNIYISLAAVFLTLETQVQLGMKPQLHPYLFIIFFATLFEYNLHRLITVITKHEALNDKKHKWIKQHLRLFYLLVIISVLGFLCTLFLAKKEVLITLAPIGVLTLFYSLPIFKNKKHHFRLREIPGLKIFLIAFVWSAVTILLPIIQSGNSYNIRHVLILFMERFFFIFAITIPFDIRDMGADSRAGLKTIPLVIGESKALIIANISLLLFLMLCIFHYQNTDLVFILPAFIVSAISTFIVANNKRIKMISYYHYGILDGTLLFQGLLVCICYYFRDFI